MKFDVVLAVCRAMGLLLPNEKTAGRILEFLFLANKVPLERDAQWFKMRERTSHELDKMQKDK